MSNSLEELLAMSRKPAEFIPSAILAASDLDSVAQLDIIQESGFQAVEVRGAFGKSVAELANSELKTLEQAISGRDLRVSAIGSPVGETLITADFAPDLELFERMLEVSDWLGSSYIRLGGYKLPTGEAAATYGLEMKSRFEKMATLAQPYGMILLLENAPATCADSAARCAELIHEVGSANLRSLFNPANFQAVGEQPFSQAYPLLQSQLTYWRFDSQAAAEMQELLAALHASSYAGFVSLESAAALAGFQQMLNGLEQANDLEDFF